MSPTATHATTSSDICTADDAPITAEDNAIEGTLQLTNALKRARRWRIRRPRWSHVIVYGVLPAIALTLAVAAGYFKFEATTAHDSQLAGINAVHAANDTTVAMLSYKPDSVDRELPAAASRLTGQFKDAYTSLIRDVVIPGAKDKHITSVATVAAAAPVSVSENQVVVISFVNQTITFGKDAPTSTASSVRITLDKMDGKWLISSFDPV